MHGPSPCEYHRSLRQLRAPSVRQGPRTGATSPAVLSDGAGTPSAREAGRGTGSGAGVPHPAAAGGATRGPRSRHGGRRGASGGGSRRISGSASAARGGEAAGGDDIRRRAAGPGEAGGERGCAVNAVREPGRLRLLLRLSPRRRGRLPGRLR